MTTTKHLLEAATLIGESAAEDGTWKVKVISEGKGSSGTYTATLLENHHHAFDNVLSFRNHPTGWDGPETRDFTMIAGEIKGETWVESDERGLKAIYANYLPDPEYKEKLERYKGKLGLSIYIEGSGYVDESTGDFVVDWFNPEDPYASLDVVIAPGARGKFLESARKAYEAREDAASTDRPGARQAERKEIRMDDELKEALKGISDALASLVAEKKTADAAEAQVKADEAAVTSAVEAYDVARKAIDEADLLAPQREELLKAAKRGEDITSAIESAKAVKEAALQAAGRISEGAAPGREFGGEHTSRFGAWS